MLDAIEDVGFDAEVLEKGALDAALSTKDIQSIDPVPHGTKPLSRGGVEANEKSGLLRKITAKEVICIIYRSVWVVHLQRFPLRNICALNPLE